MSFLKNLPLFLIVLAIALSTSSCSKDPGMSNLKICNSLNSDNKCDSNVTNISCDDPSIAFSVDLEGTTDEDFITIDLMFDGQIIYSSGRLNVDASADFAFVMFDKPPNLKWNAGTWTIRATLESSTTLTSTTTVQVS